MEDTPKHIQVICKGVLIADTRRARWVLETSHPPTYYLPPKDVRMQHFHPSARRSFCEWKGQASYYSIRVGDLALEDAAWYYPRPTPGFAPIKGYIAIYANMMDACYVDGERAQPQPGGMYGGWITSDLAGPFKGIPGSWGW